MDREPLCILEAQAIIEDRFNNPLEEPHDIAHFMYQISPEERLIVELSARAKVRNIERFTDVLTQSLDEQDEKQKSYESKEVYAKANIIATDSTLRTLQDAAWGQLEYYGYYRDSRDNY